MAPTCPMGQKQEVQAKVQGNILDTAQKLELSESSTSTLSKTQIASSVTQAIATTSSLSGEQKATIQDKVQTQLNSIADLTTLTDGTAGTPPPVPAAAPPDDHDHAPLTNGQSTHVANSRWFAVGKNF